MKIFQKILNVISIVIIALAVIILLNVVLTKNGEAPNIFGYSVFRVMTGSMEPTIRTDSLIITKKVDAATLEIGDVISYYSRDPSLDGAVNTHRITDIKEENGKIVFQTKGDANNVEDLYPAYEGEIVGKVIFISRKLGKAVRLISNPLIFIPVIVIPFIIVIIVNIVKTVKITNEIIREEEEKARQEVLAKLKKNKKSDGDAKGDARKDGKENKEENTDTED